MRHVGQELGFGPVRGLGALGFLHVFVIELDQFARPFFLCPAGKAEVMDRRHQPALAVDQLLLVQLDLGDVGADRDGASVPGPQFVHLQPAAIGKLPLEGHAALLPVGVGKPALRGEGKHAIFENGARGARHHVAIRQAVVLLVLGIAHDQALGRIPEHEGFVDVFDGRSQAKIRGLGA